MEKTAEKNAGWVFLVLSALCWSVGGLLIKSTSWGAISVTVLRGVMSFLLYLLLVRPKKIRLTRSNIISAACYFIQGMLIVTALKITTAGNASLLQNTSPMFIMFLNFILLSKRPTREELLTCAVLFAGVAFCCLGNASSGRLGGDLIALLSGLFYAGVYFFNGMKDADAMESLILGNSMYVLLIPVIFFDPGVRMSTGKDVIMVVAFGLLTGTVAWYFFSRGIRNTNSLRASFITMLEPVLAPVWTLVFIGEKMRPLSILGGIIVVVTLTVYNLRRFRESDRQIPDA